MTSPIDFGIPDLTGRTALITGANSGLGRVTARVLAGRGAHVVLARQNPGSDPTEPAVRTGDEGRAVSKIGDAEVDRRSHDAILEFRPGSQLSGRTAEAPNLLG